MKTKTLTIREELIAEGRQEGSIQSRYEVARRLIQRNMPIEDICDLTNLTYEEVRTLIEKGN